jgi:uncharacterized membrane protein YgdD (TMEM256/DUF423 family)
MVKPNYKWFFFSGALAVFLGAFGAHALQKWVDAKTLHTYETAVHYHFYHTLVLIATIWLQHQYISRSIRIAQLFFTAGLFLFCGSLYLLVTLKAIGFTSFSWLGMITPLGGLSFIIGWLMLFFFFFFQSKRVARK